MNDKKVLRVEVSRDGQTFQNATAAHTVAQGALVDIARGKTVHVRTIIQDQLQQEGPNGGTIGTIGLEYVGDDVEVTGRAEEKQ